MKKVLFTDCAFFDKDIQSFKEHNIKIFKVPGDLPEDGLIHQLKRCQGYVIGGADKATKKVIESTNLEIIKFILTPHVAYASKEAVENMNKMVIENLIAFFSGTRPHIKSIRFTFELLHTEIYQTRSQAMRRELQLKKWSRAKKEALVNDNSDPFKKA